MTDLKSFSRAVFGNSYRLELLAAIARCDHPFFAREIAAELGVADNLITTQLKGLVAAGLLESLDTRRINYYERRPSPLWQVATELAEEDRGRRDSKRESASPEQGPQPQTVAGVEWAVTIIAEAGLLLQELDGTRFSVRRIASDLQRLLAHLAAASPTELSTSSIRRLAENAGLRQRSVQLLLQLPMDLITMGVFEWNVKAGSLAAATRLRLETIVDRSRIRTARDVQIVSGVPVVPTLTLSAETPAGAFVLAQVPVLSLTDDDLHDLPMSRVAGDLREPPPLQTHADYADYLVGRVALFRKAAEQAGHSAIGLSQDLPVLATLTDLNASPMRLANVDRAAVLDRLDRRGLDAVVLLNPGDSAATKDELSFVPATGDPCPLSHLLNRFLRGVIDGFEWAPEWQPGARAVLLQTGRGGLVVVDRLMPVIFVLDPKSSPGVAATNISLATQTGRQAVAGAAAAALSRQHLLRGPLVGSRSHNYAIRQGTRHLGPLLALLEAASTARSRESSSQSLGRN